MHSERDIFDAINKFPSVSMPDSMLEQCKTDPSKSVQIASKRGARWVEAEPYIIDAAVKSCTDTDGDNWTVARNVIHYSKNVIGGRWQDFEDAILKASCVGLNIRLIIEYCNNVLGHRWTAIESNIKTPSKMYEYSYHVLKSRWPEREDEILKDINTACTYCFHVVAGKWKAYEDKILSNQHDPKAMQSRILQYSDHFGRWQEAEQFIDDPHVILHYAMRVIGGRWKEKESILAKFPSYAFTYAQEVIKGPFPEAEKGILESPWYFDYFTFATQTSRNLASQLSAQFPADMTVGEVLKLIDDGRNSDFEKKLLNSTHNQGKAVWYAVNVLKSRWPEMEEKIKKSAKCSVAYARDIIKGRWEEAEKYIAKNDKYLSQYGIEVIKGKLPDVLHNKMIASAMRDSKNSAVVAYFDMLEGKI